MKILFVSMEVVPFAKVGGLGDVAGSLPKAISHLGHDIRVILPLYRNIREKFNVKPAGGGIDIKVAGKIEKTSLFQTNLPGSKAIAYFVANKHYYDRDGIYGDNGGDYPDSLERYTHFSKAVIECIKSIDWKPDVVHCNDWQSALIVMYLKTVHKDDPFYKDTAVVYSTHNMGYQGIFEPDKLGVIGITKKEFAASPLNHEGKINFAKAAFTYADLISTVSEKFSEEIQTPEYGYGLDPVVKARSKDVIGILNGLDYELWDPKTDKHIAKDFSVNDLSGKAEDKKDLQKIKGLPVDEKPPLIGIVSRLVDQKGFDILAAAMPAIMKMNVQFVILGTGESKYHKMFSDFHEKYPKKLALDLKFDAALAQKIYAGSDMFLMPSNYEPCGLGQLISYSYGTIPVVRKTGGLADTVIDCSSGSKGCGFVFEKYSPQALTKKMKEAVDMFNKKKEWQELMRKVMGFRYTWDVSAEKYIELYNRAIKKIK
ncbi:glycogen synthase [Candidatus Margulisiibacteriota bacterium]